MTGNYIRSRGNVPEVATAEHGLKFPAARGRQLPTTLPYSGLKRLNTCDLKDSGERKALMEWAHIPLGRIDPNHSDADVVHRPFGL